MIPIPPWEVTLGTEQEYQGQLFWLLQFSQEENGYATVVLTPMNKLYKPVTVTWDYAMSKWPPDAPKWLKQMIGAWRTIDTGRSAGLYNVQQTARFKDEDSEAGLFRKFRDYLS